MNKPIRIIIDFDDTLVESNTARDVLRENMYQKSMMRSLIYTNPKK